MANLSDMTIVILSYQRQSFLIRTMGFWSGRLPTVIVFDGTENPVPSEIIGRMAPNIQYHWMNDKYEDRLSAAVSLIHTKYVVQLCDDEFYLPSGLEACIEELESDKQLIACVGRCLYCWPRKGKITVMHYYTWWKSILQDTSQERMEATMQAMHALTIYSVMRRENWINNIKVLIEKKFSCCYVTEHQFELFSAFQGKAKLIDVLSWFRSGENHPKSFKGWDRSFELEDWFQKESYKEEIDALFKIYMKHVISIFPEIEVVSMEKGFRKAADMWVTAAESGKTRMSRLKAPFRKFAGKIAANLPRSIKYPLKDVLGLAKGQFEFKQIPEKLGEIGVSCNLSDLKDIEKRLTDFYG